MNSAHVIAWLTCLILAFFACILSVRNAGRTLSTTQEVKNLEQKFNSMKSKTYQEKRNRIQNSLDNIQDELKALKEKAEAETTPEMESRIEKLQELLKNLEGLIQEPTENSDEGQ